jgi:hypothetical protein
VNRSIARTFAPLEEEHLMSEPSTTPPKDGGLKQAAQPKPSDEGLTKTGAGETREKRSADDVELEDSPGGRDGGMIGEG